MKLSVSNDLIIYLQVKRICKVVDVADDADVYRKYLVCH